MDMVGPLYSSYTWPFRPGGIQIDRKRMQALQEKRQAQGRKGHVYEEYNGPTMSM